MELGTHERDKNSKGVASLAVALIILWVFLDVISKLFGLATALILSLSLAVAFWVFSKFRS